MKRELALRRERQSLDTLAEAVRAMKSLSAYHLRAARRELSAARSYRDGIDAAMAAAGLGDALERPGKAAVLAVAADLGLCDGYNTRLAEAALAECRQREPVAVYVVGRRLLPALTRAAAPVVRTYAAVTSVAGLAPMLLTLADDVLGEYVKGTFSTLFLISARFDGVGAFTPTTTRVLPMAPSSPPARRVVRTPYVTREHLGHIAAREYLYSTLYELLLDALASEHGMRLVSTQAAEEWLDARIAQLQRRIASVRRESSTQEVLEVAAGARRTRSGAADRQALGLFS
jgi:F-type H+-transporting ATPase subunit gamma